MAQVAVDFPDRDPQFDNDFHALVKLQQSAFQYAQAAYEMRQSVERAEMANLPLQQALSIVYTHYTDQCSNWPAGHRAISLIRSVVHELRATEQGAANPEQEDTGPPAAVHLLAEARGHLEMTAPISGPGRPGVEMAAELVDLALQDVAQLQQRLELIKRQGQ